MWSTTLERQLHRACHHRSRPVLVAISTGGRIAVLARRLRERLEGAIPARIGELESGSRRCAKPPAKAARYRRAAAILRGGRGRPAARACGGETGPQRIAQQLLATTGPRPRDWAT